MKKLLKLLMLSCSLLLSLPVHAHRLDIQATTLSIDLGRYLKDQSILMYGLGIAYDFRTPYNRPGWSLVPSIAHLVHFQTIQNNPFKANSVVNYFLPSASARYRYYFNRTFAMDFNIGATFILHHVIYYEKRYEDNKTYGHQSYDYSLLPLPFVAIGGLYTFSNDFMLGMNISAWYTIPLRPLFNLYCSLPLFNQSDKT